MPKPILDPVSKYAKDALIKRFPSLQGKSDDYINGWWRAAQAYLNPVEIEDQPEGPTGPKPPKPPQPPEFDFPKRIIDKRKKPGDSESGDEYTSDYKNFPDKNKKPQPPKPKQPEKGEADKDKDDQKKKKPTLSEIPDDDELKKEEEKRKAQIEKEQEEETKSGGSHSGDGHGEERELTFDERVKAIRDIFNDENSKTAALDDIRAVKNKLWDQKQQREIKKYQSSPLTSFIIDLNNFIKKELAFDKTNSWSKINKTYYGTGIIRPGSTRQQTGHIPQINVYFDQSGSWGKDDIAAGNKALATLAEFERRGKIKVNVYYFSNDITTDVNSRILHGGTGAGPKIVQHIKDTGCDNVIILTDADTDGSFDGGVTVPGAVYLLWRNARPTDIQNAIKGQKHNAIYNLTNE